MKLTVACVWVRGNVPYSAEYVTRLRSMCKRSLPEHDFVCITDMAAYLPEDLQTIQVKKLEGFGWWTKLELFNPRHSQLQHGRVMYMDLDTLAVNKLDDVAYYCDGFAIVPHAGNFMGKGEKKVVKAFNSSVMSWNGGHFNDLYLDWSPEVTRRLWGDQDWLGERLVHAQTTKMPIEWFPRLSEITDRNVDDVIGRAKIVLCKKPKNLEAAKMWPWFNKAWR